MSAFIISEECMRRVVTSILDARGQRCWGAPKSMGGVLLDAPDAADCLAAALYGLNARAVYQRYWHEEPIPEYAHRSLASTPLEAHKAVCCLLYQCAEGDVPQTRLYLELAAFRNWLAETIVCALPDWQRAPWG